MTRLAALLLGLVVLLVLYFGAGLALVWALVGGVLAVVVVALLTRRRLP